MNDSKEHILLVSLNLFLHKSFKEVTMQEIVEKTGLSKGAFYHYFNSKEQVFREVIHHFYTEIVTPDYSKCSRDSLRQFYIDLLDEKKTRIQASKIFNGNKERIFTFEHYFLMSDATKMLPDFRKLRAKQEKEGLQAWVKVISVARKQKEIKTDMSDEELANLFIYAGKGVGIHCMMGDKHGNSRKEIKKIWDSLYQSIQNA